MEVEIPRDHDGDVRPFPPGGGVALEQHQDGVDEAVLFLGPAVAAEEEEAEGEEAAQLLSQRRVGVGGEGLAQEEDEGADLSCPWGSQ